MYQSKRNFRHGSRESELEFRRGGLYESVPSEIEHEFTKLTDEKKYKEVESKTVETASFNPKKQKRKRRRK